MTPKDKANELYFKFLCIMPRPDKTIYDNPVGRTYHSARSCARFMVNEIIDLDYFSIEGREYWEEVLLELEKL